MLRLEFERAGIPGSVEVEVDVNGEPEALGCPPYARGFPFCRAIGRADQLLRAAFPRWSFRPGFSGGR
jgi:hypothetical protein